MEVEDTIGDYNSENDNPKMISSPDNKVSDSPVLNGISNGFSEKPKESEVNGDSHDKDKEKEKSRDKDKHKSSSSSSKHRDHSHSSSHKSKSKDRDKERDKDRDKDKEHKSSSSSSTKDKEKSSSSSSSKHHSSSSSSKDKDKHKSSSSSSGDKSKHSSSSSSDKHRSDKHSSSTDKKHSSSSSSKDKERDKERSKDKEKEKSRDKEREKDRDKERSKDKEKSRDKDKEKSRDKDKEKSREKDKERSKDKHKDKSRDKERSKDDHKDRRKDEDKVKLYNGEKEKRKSDEGKKSNEHEKPRIKEEPKDSVDSVKKVYVDDDEDDDFQPVPVKKEIKRERFIDDDDDEDDDKYKDIIGAEIKKEDDAPIKKEYDSDNSQELKPTKYEASETEENSLQIDETMKSLEDSEDDMPLSKRAPIAAKRKIPDDDDFSDEDVPLSMRKKVKKEGKKRKKAPSDSEAEDFKPAKKKKVVKKEKDLKKETPAPTKGKKKKEEDEPEVWKWWEEEKKPDGVKWTFLEHKGPVFAPPYEPLPDDVKFYYHGKPMNLSQDAEEVATFYARMIEHEYTTMDAFNNNFFQDWTSVMTSKEKSIITSLKHCDFSRIHQYFLKKSEERKAMSKEEKKVIKEQNEEVQKEYGFCTIDGHKEKIGNFRIEPPGLFRGRGQHPKMGKLKLRVMPEHVMINCSKDSKIPKAPEGHKWKEVRHDNSVTWLASWTENVQGQVKYVMLNPSSKLKGEKDWQKYEMARKLAKSVNKIRDEYTADWKSKEMRIRQRSVALYFIDKLALRAGNEKDEDQADTVGCCSLRVEHIKLHETIDDQKYVVEFDFPGKDSIRYHNFVPVEKKVFKNLQLFMENKKTGDDLFDRLNTAVLNKHLNELMEGLTAKVFRTYNASITLQNQLNELTDPDASIAEKILQYNRANRAVAILCNHQRSVPKSHDKSMGNLDEKIKTKKEQISEAEVQVKEAKREAKGGSAHAKMALDKKQKCLQRLKEQLVKLEVSRTDKDENKTIALGTSKLNYLDPRISVAWCKKYDVPIDKIYNKTQRDKFRWAIDMAGPDYVF